MSSISKTINRSRELRVQPYWETHLFAAAAPTDFAFFAAVPTVANGRPAAGIVGGNMQTAGQFPAPRQFFISGFSVQVEASVVATAGADLYILLNGCFILTIADKEYLRLLGWMAPQGGGGSPGSNNATQCFIGNGSPLAYNYFRVKPNLTIPTQQNFRVLSTQFPATALTTASWVSVVLWGIEERAVQ